MRRLGVAIGALAVVGIVAWFGWGRGAPGPDTRVDAGGGVEDASAARARREEMRARIVRALTSDVASSEASSAAAASAAPVVAASAAPANANATEHAPRDLTRGLKGVPASNLPTAYIADIYKEQLGPLTRACYEAARSRNPDAGGTVMISYIVVGAPNVGGIIDDANVDESSLSDPEFETCIHESVLSLTFDRAPNEGGWKEAGFAMEFAPPDGG